MIKKTIEVIERPYKDAIKEALNLFDVKHRFLLDIRNWDESMWNKFSKLVKKYTPKLIITDHAYPMKKCTFLELIY